jgi:predicted metalloprotease with PDZ domain
LQEPARAAGTPGRKACAITQLDKHRWRVDCLPGKPLELRYAVLAHDDLGAHRLAGQHTRLLQRHQPVPARVKARAPSRAALTLTLLN